MKEAVLARKPPTPVPIPLDPKPQDPEAPKSKSESESGEGKEGPNPVEKSFETHHGGWATFFSSRALGMKLITGAGEGGVERDENGMEVMELDFGEDELGAGGATGAGVGSPVAQGKGTDGGQGQGKGKGGC